MPYARNEIPCLASSSPSHLRLDTNMSECLSFHCNRIILVMILIKYDTVPEYFIFCPVLPYLDLDLSKGLWPPQSP